MHGYLSRDGLPPGDLLTSGRNEVTSYGGEILAGTALDLTADGPSGFCVLLENGQRISARRLLVTTGLRDELPDIPGLQERWARDLVEDDLRNAVRDHTQGFLPAYRAQHGTSTPSTERSSS
jgi:thioredoxin reductase